MRDADSLSDTQLVMRWIWAVFVALTLLVVFLLICWLGFGAVGRWNKERTFETNRKDIVIEAQAQADAAEARTESEVAQAERLAQRDRIRAQGIADANTTIAATLSPEYIQWYWVDRLDEVDGQIIYVPGEGFIPVPEAGRAVP